MSISPYSPQGNSPLNDAVEMQPANYRDETNNNDNNNSNSNIAHPETYADVPVTAPQKLSGATEAADAQDNEPMGASHFDAAVKPHEHALHDHHEAVTAAIYMNNEALFQAADEPSLLGGGEGNCVTRALSRFQMGLARLVPPGGHISNVFNFASNTLGIGIVSMASGFNQTGVVLSAILMVICACMVVFSFYLLGKTAELTHYRFSSWELASRNLLFRGADYCVCGVMIFLQLGGMTGYTTGAFELLVPFLDDDSVDPFLKTANGHRLLTATIWFFGMFLLCIPRKLASLRYASIIGVGFVIYFVFAVVARTSLSGWPHVHEMPLFATGLNAVNGLSLFIFAFLGHGLALRTAQEAVVNHTKRRIRAVGAEAAAREPPFRAGRMLAIDSACSVTMIGILYFIVGIAGLSYVGPTISGSIFAYFSVRDDPMMCVAYIGILLKICAAYALSNQACRLPIYYCLGRSVDAAPFWQHFIITCVVCVLTLILGLFIPDISIVFNLLGSICGGVLAFLLPVYYVCFIGGWTVKNVGLPRILMSVLNLVGGVVAIVFGTAVTIDGLVKTYG